MNIDFRFETLLRSARMRYSVLMLLPTFFDATLEPGGRSGDVIARLWEPHLDLLKFGKFFRGRMFLSRYTLGAFSVVARVCFRLTLLGLLHIHVGLENL